MTLEPGAWMSMSERIHANEMGSIGNMDDKLLRNRSGRIAAVAILAFAGMWQMAYAYEWGGFGHMAHDEVKDVEEGSSVSGYVSDFGAEEMDVQAPDVRYVETPEYSGYVFPTAVNGFRYLLSLAHPEIHHRLTDEEVALAEEILRDKLTEFCIARWGAVPDVLSDMKRFKRQYTSWKELEGIPDCIQGFAHCRHQPGKLAGIPEQAEG